MHFLNFFFSQDNCMCIHINKNNEFTAIFFSMKVLNFAKGEPSACWAALTDWFFALAVPPSCHLSLIKLPHLSLCKEAHSVLQGTQLSQVGITLGRVRIRVQLRGEDACHSVMQCLSLLLLEKMFPDSLLPDSWKDSEVCFCGKRAGRKQRNIHRLQGHVNTGLSWYYMSFSVTAIELFTVV